MRVAPRWTAAVAAGLLALAGIAGAQNTNWNSVSGSLTGTGISSSCPTKFGDPTNPLLLNCSATNGNYALGATAGALAGGPVANINSGATFSGALPGLNPGDDPATAKGSAVLLQYLTFTGPTETIFKIVITAEAHAIVTNEDPTDITSSGQATLESGAVDQFGNLPSSPPQDVFTQSIAGDVTHQLSTTVFWDQAMNADCANNGGDAAACNTTYFSFVTMAQIGADALPKDPGPDPNASVFIEMFRPTVTIYVGDEANNHVALDGVFTVSYNQGAFYAVTATPEPASLTLLATGLAGVAGVARRRRRATLGSN